MLANLTVASRLTLVENIGTPSIGGSLAGLNVNELPAGALVYVSNINRCYELRKNLDAAVVPDEGAFRNIVSAVGSSRQAGYFVACEQQGQVTLTGGEATAAGFDFSRTGRFLSSIALAGGTVGKYVIFTPQDAGTLAIQSQDSDDTSTYFFMYFETPS